MSFNDAHEGTQEVIKYIDDYLYNFLQIILTKYYTDKTVIGLMVVINAICFYFFDKFFKRVVKKRESYLEVFYLIDKNLISNSLLKCELLLNYINEKDKQINTNYNKTN